VFFLFESVKLINFVNDSSEEAIVWRPVFRSIICVYPRNPIIIGAVDKRKYALK